TNCAKNVPRTRYGTDFMQLAKALRHRMYRALNQFRTGFRPSEELVSWMRDPAVQKGATLSLEDWRRRRPNAIPENEWQRVADVQFFQAIEEAVRGAGVPAAAINTAVDSAREYGITGSGASLDTY